MRSPALHSPPPLATAGCRLSLDSFEQRGADRSERLRRSISSRRNTSRNSASASLDGMIGSPPMTPLGKSEAVARGGVIPSSRRRWRPRSAACRCASCRNPSSRMRAATCAWRAGSCRFLRSGRQWFDFLRRGVKDGLREQKRGEQQGDQRRAPFGEGGDRQRAGRLFVNPFPFGSWFKLPFFNLPLRLFLSDL